MSDLAVSEITPITRRSHPENPPQSVGRILIIDDEAEIRESLETLLQLEGYTVVVAGSGREGLAQIGQRAFDVVLLDLALPDKNGMDVLSEIRVLHAQQAVIMITAYGSVENAVRAMQSGATNFIQKPWDSEKLLADVRAAVARQKAEEEKHSTEARAQAALQLRAHRGQERAHAEDFRSGRPGSTQPLDRTTARRKRNGQRTDRQVDSSEFYPARPTVRARQLRIDAARPA